MPTKVPYILTSHEGLYSLISSTGLPLTAPNASAQRTRKRATNRPSLPACRRLHVHPGKRSQDRPPSSPNANFDPSWPPDPPRGAAHSPYDILCQHRDRPYSRRRFIELVKLYHPDRRPASGHHPVAHSVRVERYRLAVAAHEILNDPARRRAFDACGAGWRYREHRSSGNGTDPDTHAGADGAPYTRTKHDGRPWSRYDDNSPFTNATWEDWHAWYAREHAAASARQARHDAGADSGVWNERGWGSKVWARPVAHVANGSSVVITLLLLAFAAVHEVRRAQRRASEYSAQLQATHGEASNDLARRRGDSHAAEARDSGWMEGFLRPGGPSKV